MRAEKIWKEFADAFIVGENLSVKKS